MEAKDARTLMRFVAALLIATLVAASCGGDDDDAGSSSDDEERVTDDEGSDDDGAEEDDRIDAGDDDGQGEDNDEGSDDDDTAGATGDLEAQQRLVDDPLNCLVDNATFLARATVDIDALSAFLANLEIDVGSIEPIGDELLLEEGTEAFIVEIANEQARLALAEIASDDDLAPLLRDNQIAPHYEVGLAMGWTVTPGEKKAVMADEFVARDFEYTTDPQHVLVLDSGFEPGRTDRFDGRVIGEGDPTTPTTEEYGHGTFIAGIIAQVNAEALVTVLSVDPTRETKIWEMGNMQRFAQTTLEKTVVQKAVDSSDDVERVDGREAPSVINMSLGAYPCNALDSNGDPILLEPIGLDNAVMHLRSAYPEAEIVASAGNDGLDIAKYPFYPAAFPGVIAVGAWNESLAPAIWNNPLLPNPNVEGGNRGSNLGTGLVWAPGQDVWSSHPGSVANLATDELVIASWSGTSFATACVSGMLSIGLTVQDVQDAIKSGDTPCWELLQP